jgi:hypothetical protein
VKNGWKTYNGDGAYVDVKIIFRHNFDDKPGREVHSEMIFMTKKMYEFKKKQHRGYGIIRQKSNTLCLRGVLHHTVADGRPRLSIELNLGGRAIY